MGLVFNPGERVEGYTNFLWTVLLAGWIKLGVDPVAASQLMGVLCFAASLIGVFVLGQRLSMGPGGWIALLLVASNYTFLSYATGGLETQMQSCLFIWILVVLTKSDSLSVFHCLAGSLLLTLAFLTRMDSALIIAPAVLMRVWRSWKFNNVRRVCFFMGFPSLLIVCVWFGWKLAYYGSILPNTYWVKASSVSAYVGGLFYIALFVFSYGYFLLLAPVWRLLPVKKRTMDWRIVLLIMSCGLWITYVVKIGGGFMEFRMMVPVLPILAVLIAKMLLAAYKAKWTVWILVAMFAAISFFHSTRDRLYGVETIKGLENHVMKEKWALAGQRLNEEFSEQSVWIATTAAGALPYYAGLPTVDLLGLNDVWVAHHGVETTDESRKWLGPKPGHRKKATLDYVYNRGVHLLIGAPKMVPLHTDPLELSLADFTRGGYLSLDPAPFKPGAKLVGLPLDDHSMMLCAYIKPNREVEEALQQGRLLDLSTY